VTLLVLGVGCASAPPQEEIPSAESYYGRGLETLEGQRVFLFFRDVDYARAIELFQEVIDNYPYSNYATLSELKIADVYFEQSRFEEAAGYYQDFVELHPSHPQVPYSVYRRGLCGFRQMRDADRDQAPTQDVVSQFRFLLERFPESEYSSDAREKLAEAEDRLAQKILRVADFYLDRGDYYAAAERYREAIDSYPQHSGHQQTLFRLAVALESLGERAEAQEILEGILRSNPDGDLGEEVEETLRDWTRRS
jgi:outer membrane protein assembly factor BamD